MPAHVPMPSQLRDDYDAMLTELKALIAPYLPENVRSLAVKEADAFQEQLNDYAMIDAIFRAFRDNGMPKSHRHRAKQLIDDYIATQKAQRPRAA